jgi:hypothetical protein
MGKTSLTLQDAWSILNNPATMCNINAINIGIFYENKFLMKETGYGALSFASPFANGNIGMGVTHYGFNLFQQNKVTLGYSKQLFQNLSMGVNINYFSVQQSSFYGNLNTINFDLGFLITPTKNFSIGTTIINPLNIAYFENNSIKMPVEIKLGFSYLFNNALLLAIETGKALNAYVPIFTSGVEYKINKSFDLRLGFSAIPIEYSFGIGYKTYNFCFDIASSYHHILGTSPKLSVSYVF